MKSRNNKIFIWYKIKLISILFKYNHIHYFLYCDLKTYSFLKFFNYKIVKIDYNNHIFDKEKNNYFFKSDYFIDKCSRKILSLFKYNTFNFKKKNLIDRIYLSFIAQDIKNNSNFFIRTKDFFLNKFPKDKIIYKLNDCEFSNIFCSILKKKYKRIDFSLDKNVLRISLFKKVVFLHFTLIINNFRKNTLKKNKPVIFQEYLNNIFNRYPDAGHLFWLDKSKINFSNINWFTFNRKLENFSFTNPITKKKEYLKNINKFDILKFNDVYNNNFFSYVKNFYPKKKNFFIFFLMEFLIKYKIEKNKKLIELNNVKILHHYQEPNYENLSLAYSCKFTDCVFIWNHWSIDQHPVFYFKYGFCDVLLSWGAWNTSYLNAHNFIYDHIFITGMIGGDKFDNYKEKISKFKKLIIFDSSSDMQSLHHPNYLLEKFYESILFLTSKEKYKVFIKPKRNIYNNLSKSLSLRLSNAIKKKKINLISNILTPSKAGNLNDLHIAWSQNTAGNIANMQGKNVLYYDNVNLKFHPFAKKSFTIKNLKDLETKIERYFNNQQKFFLNNGEKKNLSEFFDPKTTERGAFIFKKIFDYLNKKSKEKAVIDLTKEYQNKYGKNKIISKKGKFKTVKIWEKELKKIEKLYKKII